MVTGNLYCNFNKLHDAFQVCSEFPVRLNYWFVYCIPWSEDYTSHCAQKKN